jgi:hypothetical protein
LKFDLGSDIIHRMAFLAFASLVVLALWVGGLVAMGVAAPVIFSVLEAHDPAAGRVVAGLVFGAVFEHFQRYAWGLGGLQIVLLGLRAALGPRPRRLALRLSTVGLMLALSLGASFVLAPRINAIRDAVAPQTVAALPATDPRQAEFGRLHGLSNVAMLVTVGLGAALLWAEMRDRH